MFQSLTVAGRRVVALLEAAEQADAERAGRVDPVDQP